MILKNFSLDHHSFLLSIEGRTTLEGAVEILESELPALYKDRVVFSQKFITDSFSIDLARQVKAAQENRALKNEQRLLIIGFSSITNQAQNALLKVLEEPSVHTHLFILTPNKSLMLDTVRSRCVNIELYLDRGAQSPHADSFIEKSLRERLETVKEITDNKLSADIFFSNLEKEISSRKDKGVFSKPKVRSLLSQSKYHAQSNSSAAKYLLEELALTLPVK